MSKTNKKRSKTPIFIIIGALVLLGAFAAFGSKREKGTKVSVSEVTEKSIIETVAASGKIFPTTEVEISSDVSGEIVELLVEEGDSVVAGQLLAKVNPDIYQSAVERGIASVNSAKAQAANARANVERNRAQAVQAEAEVTRIKAQIENTKTIHNRNISLKEDGIISEAEFELSLSNLRTLEANLASAAANVVSSEAGITAAKETANASKFTIKSNEATLSEMRSNLRKTTIYAPTSGVISSLSVEQGERVVGTAQMAGTEMMRIANLNAMEVQVDVSENDVLRVALNDAVEISVDAYIDRSFQGVVTHIASSASNANTGTLTSDQVTNFIVKVSIDPNSYKDLVSPTKRFPFRPGMSASVDINTDKKDEVLSVPIQAVTTRIPEEDDKGEKVSKADPIEVVFIASGDTVRQIKVKTGIQDDDFIQILSGLENGTEVISAPYSAISKDLKEGDEIRIVDEKDLYKEKK